MHGILTLDTDFPTAKRRKAIHACQRCKQSKKKCSVVIGSRRCERCEVDKRPCSLERMPRQYLADESQEFQTRTAIGCDSGISMTEPPLPPSVSMGMASPREEHSLRGVSGMFEPLDSSTERDDVENAMNYSSQRAGSGYSDSTETTTRPLDQRQSHCNSSQPILAPVTPQEDIPKDPRELRYATMLGLMDKKGLISTQANPRQPFKLISGTNPLSALLGKELKHKIVTNSCSFRTPDPIASEQERIKRRGAGIQSCDWEKSYSLGGASAAQIQYMKAVGCFQLPSPERCSQLLEIFFTYVHPLLPVIDRQDFLSRYYGCDGPPPLILLHSVFLAASRYVSSGGRCIEGVPEVRSHCDMLHIKVRALTDFDLAHKRVAVIQASLISSLHWEGREGLNSAIDSMSLAIRACQEMGLHLKMAPAQQKRDQREEVLHRRIWWSAYALDRLTAAQEGTPFLINEMDCNAEILTEGDLNGEDYVTVHATLINLSLARLIEDTVRFLYAPSEDHTTLFTTRGCSLRHRLTSGLDGLESRINECLFSGKDCQVALEEAPDSLPALFGAILTTHLDAVRILVHRPFILYPEPNNFSVYPSRDSCRYHAGQILCRLRFLLGHDLLRFSWPFTVYAVVNCLLIFWYDLSSPPSPLHSTLQAARRDFDEVTRLLRAMGDTWWAAAAKHQLALALRRAASTLHGSGRQESAGPVQHFATPDTGVSFEQDTSNNKARTPPVSGTQSEFQLDIGDWDFTDDLAGWDSSQYWSSLGLDFDLDVAGNIFSIE